MKRRNDDRDKSRSDYRFRRGRRTWRRKFADAFSGLRQSVRGQSTFIVHFTAAASVVIAACLLGNFDTVRWCLLAICISTVVAAEMFNTSIETLARAVTTSYSPHVARALNIASGAVLTVAFGAAATGSILFVESLWRLLV